MMSSNLGHNFHDDSNNADTSKYRLFNSELLFLNWLSHKRGVWLAAA
jgi:hypothetical protein